MFSICGTECLKCPCYFPYSFPLAKASVAGHICTSQLPYLTASNAMGSSMEPTKDAQSSPKPGSVSRSVIRRYSSTSIFLQKNKRYYISFKGYFIASVLLLRNQGSFSPFKCHYLLPTINYFKLLKLNSQNIQKYCNLFHMTA